MDKAGREWQNSWSSSVIGGGDHDDSTDRQSRLRGVLRPSPPRRRRGSGDWSPRGRVPHIPRPRLPACFSGPAASRLPPFRPPRRWLRPCSDQALADPPAERAQERPSERCRSRVRPTRRPGNVHGTPALHQQRGEQQFGGLQVDRHAYDGRDAGFAVPDGPRLRTSGSRPQPRACILR
jgi:hypothetical protein